MKIFKIIASMFIKGIVGVLLGVAIGLCVGVGMCFCPFCKACTAESCKASCTGCAIVDAPFTAVCYFLESDREDFNQNVDYINNMIYGAVIGGSIGAIYGLATALAALNRERKWNLQERWWDNGVQLEEEMAKLANEIYEIVQQSEAKFQDITSVYNQENESTRTLLENYQKKWLDVRQTAELIQKEMGEKQ